MVVNSPSKCKTLSSNPSIEKKVQGRNLESILGDGYATYPDLIIIQCIHVSEHHTVPYTDGQLSCDNLKNKIYMCICI
jgi:hypothetical protein